MKRIIIDVAPSGELTIDAQGFKGADCERATKAIEEALGVARKKVRKPEYNQSVVKKQTVGA